MTIDNWCSKAVLAAVIPIVTFLMPLPAPAATVIGSAPTVRTYIDSAGGQVYVYAGGHFDAGLKMSTMTWNSGVAGRIITPILLEETNTSTHVYTVRGVGTTRSSVVGSQTAAFGLQYGSDSALNGNYTWGFINSTVTSPGGVPTSSTIGAVWWDYNTSATDKWYFTPSSFSGNIAVGRTFTLGGDLYVPEIRAYSATLSGTGTITAAPNPITFYGGVGQSSPAGIPVSVTSSSAGSTYTATTNQTWLTASPTSNATGGTTTVNLSANTSGLSAGLYTGVATYAASGFSSATTAVNLRMANPSGTLNPASPYSTAAIYVATGDFNGDGYTDFATTNYYNASVSIYLNNHAGGFTVTTISSAAFVNPDGILTKDLNGDGKLDLAIVNNGANSLVIVLGNGDGTFQTPVGTTTVAGTTPAYQNGIAAGDFDGDGIPDLLLTNNFGNATLWHGNGSGGFTLETTIALQSTLAFVVAGDFNGDGKLDFAAMNVTNSILNVLLGDGAGGFTNSSASPYTIPGGGGVASMTAGDLNGDGVTDLVVLTKQVMVTLLGHTTTGPNSVYQSIPVSPTANYGVVTLGDVNGDGKLDLVVSPINGKLNIHLGDGQGGFVASPVTLSSSEVDTDIAVADFNRDGLADVVAINFVQYGVSTDVYFGATAATASTLTTSGATTVAYGTNVPLSLAVTATNGFNAPTGTVTFKDGSTTLGTASASPWTFSTAGLAPGTHAITAVYGGDTRNATSTSNTLTITVTTISQTLALTPIATSSTYGQPVTFTATISPITTGNVTFYDGATALGTGALNGSGIATYSTSALTGGAHAITAQFAAAFGFSGATSGVQTQWVSPAAATVALSGLTPVFDGSAKPATATTTPTSLANTIYYASGATTLQGTTVGVKWAYPDTATTYGDGGSAVVGSGVEFTNCCRSDNQTFNVDFSDTAIVIDDIRGVYTSGQFSPLGFNGLVITTTVNLTSVNLAYNNWVGPGSPFGASNVTFDQHHIYVNFQGFLTITGQRIILTVNSSTTAPSALGTYGVAAIVTGNNYTGVANGSLVISPPPVTVTLTPASLSQIYTGSPLSAAATTAPANLAVSFTYNGSATPPTNAGSYAVVASATNNGATGTASGTLVIAKAAAAVSLSNLSPAYTGGPLSATVTTNPPNLNVGVTYGGSATVPTAAGSYAVVATVNDTNYSGSASGTLVIGKAAATVTLGSLAQTYGAVARSATATTSPAGLNVTFTYNGSATAPTNAGSYTVIGTVNDANGTGSATGTLVISKVATTVTLAGLAQSYTGTARTVTATTAPFAGMAVSLTYNGSATAPTNAGSYPIVATVTDANGTGSASGTLVVSPAAATVTLAGLAQTYNGATHPVTATTSPAGLNVTFTYAGSATAPTNAGSYAVVATVSDANGTGSATGTLVVAKATATVTLGSLSQTYTGTARVATATTNPANLAVTFTYNASATAPVNAGSYAVVGTVNDTNYAAVTASGTLVVAQATATMTFIGLAQTYDGTARTVTAVTTPASLAVALTYNFNTAAPVNAGTYSVAATVTDANYTGANSGTLVVSPAVATITLGSLSQTYNGSTHPVAATTNPATGVTVSFTYAGSATAPTNAGSYAVVATAFGNYSGTASGTLVVAKAPTTVTLSNLTQTYTGATLAAGASASPGFNPYLPIPTFPGPFGTFFPGVPTIFPITVTYNGSAAGPVNTGSYAVVATVVDSNYAGAASGTLVVSPAVATVTLSNLTQAYAGAPRSATVTVTPSALPVTVTYNGGATAPTAAGSYAVVATVTGSNGSGSASGTLVIQPAQVVLSNLTQIYTSSPLSVATGTIPAGLPYTVTYNGSTAVPTAIGTYAVVATVNGPANSGSASGTFVIQPPPMFNAAAGSPYTAGGAASSLVAGDFNNDGKADLLVVSSAQNTITDMLNNGTGGFNTSNVSPSYPQHPAIVAGGNFFGQNRTDIVVISAGNGTSGQGLSLNAAPNFQGPVGIAVPIPGPTAVVVADFNRDGIVDFAILGGNKLAVYSSGMPQTAPVVVQTLTLAGVNLLSSSTNQAAAGDFNGDGYPDIAVPSTTGVQILLNNGASQPGLFSTGGNVPVDLGTGSPRAVVTGDFDGDGNLDFAVTDQHNNVNFYKGLGDGTFSLFSSFAAGTGAEAMTVADFNRDGKLDIAVANRTAGTVTVLLGNGDGTFIQADGSPFALPAGSTPQTIGSGDFDGDGRTDVVVGNASGAGITVLLNVIPSVVLTPKRATVNLYAEAGKPSPRSASVPVKTTATSTLANTQLTVSTDQNWLSATPTSATVGGTTNVALSGNAASLTAGTYKGKATFNAAAASGGAQVILNVANPTGQLGTGVPVAVAPWAQYLATGDLNGDGVADYVVASNLLDRAGPVVQVLLSNGSGGSTPTALPGMSSVLNGNTNVTAVAMGDFNGDGNLDIALLSTGGGQGSSSINLVVIPGTGTGGFRNPVVTSLPGFGTPNSWIPSMAAADFNGDGKTDVVVRAGGYFEIVLGGNGGALLPASAGPTAYQSQQDWNAPIATGDFNGDGNQDFAYILGGGGQQLVVGYGDGTGLFTLQTGASAVSVYGGSVTGLTSGDFNGDGFTDLAIAAGTVEIYPGRASGVPVRTSSLNNIGLTGAIAVGDLNGDGKLDLVTSDASRSVLDTYIGDGSGGFTASLVFAVPNSNGRLNSIVVADINGDGKTDVLATYNALERNVEKFLGGSAPTTGALTITGASSVAYTGTTTLTLAVTAPAGYNAPTGIATLKDGGTVVATSSQTASPWSFVYPALAGGAHSLTAVYGGDARDAASTSNAVTVTVTAAPSGLTLAPLTPSTFGQAVTFTANVAPGSTGTVTFYDGTTAIGTGALSAAGLATLTTSALTAGNHPISAKVTANSNIGAATSGTLTQVVNKAAATVVLGTLNFTYDGTAKAATATVTPSTEAVTIAYAQGSTPVTAPTNAGSYTVTATVNTANYSGTATGTLVIAKAVAKLTFNELSFQFNGAPKPVAVTTVPANLTTVSFTYNGGATVPSAVADYTVVATLSNINYSGTATGTESIHITAVTHTALSPINASNRIAWGDGQPTLTATVTPPLVGTVDFYSGTTKVGSATSDATGVASLAYDYGTYAGVPGTYAITAVYRGDSANAPSSSAPQSFLIDKISTFIHCYQQYPNYYTATFDGRSHAPIFGIRGPTSIDDLNLPYHLVNLDGTPYQGINVGRWSVYVVIDHPYYKTNFPDFNGSGSGCLEIINIGTASISLQGSLSQTYDGTPKVVSVVTSPAGISTTAVTYTPAGGQPTTTPPVNAGVYTVSAALNDGNFSPRTANGTLVISKAASTVTMQGIVPGTAGACGAGCAGWVGAFYTYTGQPVAPAAATVTPAAATVTPAGTPLNITYTQFRLAGGANITNGVPSTIPPTNAGYYRVDVGNPNYTGSANAWIQISQKFATLTPGGYNVIYDGSPKPVRYVTDPPNLALVTTYYGIKGTVYPLPGQDPLGTTPPSARGSYQVYTYIADPNSNYQGSNQVTLEIHDKYVTTTAVSAPTSSPWGSSITFTAKVSGAVVAPTGLVTFYDGATQLGQAIPSSTGLALLSVPVSGAQPLTAGDHAITAIFAGDVWNQPSTSPAVTQTVTKLATTITFGSLAQTYNGSPKPVTASSSGTLQNPLAITYTPAGGAASSTAPTAAGSYTVTATVPSTDPHFVGTASATLVIASAAATLTLPSTVNIAFNNTPRTVTPVVSPAGLAYSVTYQPQDGSSPATTTPPTYVNYYNVTATLTDPNYTATPATSVLQIFGVSAQVNVTNLNQNYNGSQHTVTVTTVPPNLPYTVTYNGSTSPPISSGNYTVLATITPGGGYSGQGGGTLVVNAMLAVNLSGRPGTNAAVTIDGVAINVNGTFNPVTPGTHTISMVPDQSGSPRSVFNHWGDNGALTHTITAVDQVSHYLYLDLQYPTVLASSPSSGGVLTGPAWVTIGAAASVVATPAAGYVLDSIVYNNVTNPASGLNPANTLQFFGPNSSFIPIQANFVPAYTVTAAVSPAGAGSVTGLGLYRLSSPTFTAYASPAAGWVFDHWSLPSGGAPVAGTPFSLSGQYLMYSSSQAFTTSGGNVGLVANFVKAVPVLTATMEDPNKLCLGFEPSSSWPLVISGCAGRLQRVVLTNSGTAPAKNVKITRIDFNKVAFAISTPLGQTPSTKCLTVVWLPTPSSPCGLPYYSPEVNPHNQLPLLVRGGDNQGNIPVSGNGVFDITFLWPQIDLSIDVGVAHVDATSGNFYLTIYFTGDDGYSGSTTLSTF